MYTPSRFHAARQHGFTLVELMVTLVIMAILVTIAASSYRRYAMRANRTDATIQLLRVQVAQEKRFLQANAYATDDATMIATTANGGLGIASTTTPGGYYTLALTAQGAGYLITATARGTQVNDTGCTVFTLTDTGLRTGCW